MPTGLGIGLSLSYGGKVNTPIPILYGASFFITVTPQYCTSDAGHTTPCTNGTTIAAWYEQVSKTWVTWATSGGSQKPTFNVSGSVYSADFNTAPTHAGFVFSNVWPQGDVTIVQRFTPNANTGCAWGNSSNFGVYEGFRATTTGTVQRFNTGPTATLTNSVDTTLSYTGTGILAGSVEKMRSSAGGNIWNTVNNARPTYVGCPTDLQLFSGAGLLGPSNFKGMAVFPTVLTDAQITAVEAYFNSL